MKTGKNKFLFWFWLIVGACIVLPILILVMVWAFADIPSFKELESPDSKLATQLLSDDGRVLSTFHIENRSYVPYESLAPSLVQAAVATEDKRFYNHSGIDFLGLGRVLFKTILMRDSSQGGGSTITQQLAKTLYPREDMSSPIPGGRQIKMVITKLKEWVTAVKLERCYTKEEIVDMYLNAVFFGSNAYGIQAASGTFFGKEPRELSVEESATLVGMVNKPTRYNPALNPEQSLERRNFVIDKMYTCGYLTMEERDSISALPIILNYRVKDHNEGLAPYFRDMLRRTMNAKQPSRSSYSCQEEYEADSLLWADDQLYGWLTKNRKADGSSYDLDRDGLRIYTTINYDMQKYAEEAVAEHLAEAQKNFDKEIRWRRNRPFDPETEQATVETLMRNARRWSDRYRGLKKAGMSEAQILKTFDTKVRMRVFSWNQKGYEDVVMTPNDSIRYYKSIIRSACMAMEPGTGAVKVYVGGPNYRYFKYDNIRQGRRQVGSTAKPFLYTLAMQEGKTPCSTVLDVPQTFAIVGQDGTWTPKGDDSGNLVTLKWGLKMSSNNVSAALMKEFGPEAMVEMMRRMGIGSHLDAVPSLCVGSCDLSLYEMVPAYNVFPSHGVYVSPIFVTRIMDNKGAVLGTFTSRAHEAISDHTASTMVGLMEGVVNSGTGIRLRYKYGLKGHIAGKTGTTNDNSDAWFIAYTPKLTMGVWSGAEDRQVHFASTASGQGSAMALPVWALFMQKVLENGKLGISETDEFYNSSPGSESWDCEDVQDAGGVAVGGDDNFFE